jgi:hypothetical protein
MSTDFSTSQVGGAGGEPRRHVVLSYIYYISCQNHDNTTKLAF